MAKDKKLKIVDDDEPKAMRVRSTHTEDSEDSETPEVTEVAEAEEQPAVNVAKGKADWVRINCYVDVDPAPVVGSFSFAHDCNIMKLEAKKVYSCPRFVAEHLVDKKVGVIIPD